ncbi:MAG: hypothetical protein A2579_14145 [Lysobacterales bacterium RIFOXYD1_FULL_69_11]|nr:MAG: hypothetical protein A2579_14145 [Xanthomonadales bacterium RIFOXYD1_FULL_69_11]
MATQARQHHHILVKSDLRHRVLRAQHAADARQGRRAQRVTGAESVEQPEFAYPLQPHQHHAQHTIALAPCLELARQ